MTVLVTSEDTSTVMVTSPLYLVSLVINSLLFKTQSSPFSDYDAVLLSIFIIQNNFLISISDLKNYKTYNLGCTIIFTFSLYREDER